MFPVLPPAILALADGTVFVGHSIGATGSTVGEVVFNTALTGYQEILTDPSYCRQIVTLTYPHIGNYGVNLEDIEADKVHAAGLIIKNLPLLASNFRSHMTLSDYLVRENTVAIADIDTRKLTRLLRTHGAQNGCILVGDVATEEKAQLVQLQFAQWQGSMQGDIQRDGGEIVAALGSNMTDICRIDPGIVTGLEMTGHLVQGQAVELAALPDQRRLGDGARNDRKLHDGHAGHGTQVVGPEHVEQTVGQLGELILDLGAQVAREKRKAFQQAFHVRVGILLRQKTGEFGIAIGKFAPLQAQKSQFIPEVMFQRH